MITVQISRKEDGRIHGFEVKGHAGYADPGQDIVCAGVSSVTVGTVNSIEALTGTIMETRMKGGFLSAVLPSEEESTNSGQVQLLLESMVLMLQGIADSYREYIQIKEMTTKRRR
ncbi:ribosomal-processing cysteine protease Prp [Paenibacillus sp. DMB20]|uniref:ribosomal-processing cysteine protease Prp n=1 Tax=Paenibacillus sp. DMB20 TaxID=1642570 RepID=UPI000627CD25|nr:ribosomal-processing cysteine protease Prp [Paenibacillus sp. DMB20]KKO51309.1 ribosomal protein [Paenibacillus sp. DMB20]KKO51862.1 ribosomal protein [Paenibacillus sp. DMB20]